MNELRMGKCRACGYYGSLQRTGTHYLAAGKVTYWNCSRCGDVVDCDFVERPRDMVRLKNV